MKRSFLSCALAFGLAASFLHGSSPPVHADDTVIVDLDWDQVDSISTGAPVATMGSMYYYDSIIPFKVTWDTWMSPIDVPYHMWTDDLWIDEWGYVPGMHQGVTGIFVPARMESDVTLNVEAFHPIENYTVAFDSASEEVVDLLTSYGDYTGAIPIPLEMAKDYARQGGDSLINSLFGSLFTSGVIADHAQQHNMTYAEAEDLIFDVLKPQFKLAFHPVWEGWVDGIYGLQEPSFAVRVGSGNPLQGPVQSAWDAIPQGLDAGLTSLLQPGQTVWDVVSQVVYVNLNSGAIAGVAVDAVDHIFDTGQLLDIPAMFGDTVFVNSAGLQLPMGYNSQSWTLNGSFVIGVQDVSFNKIGGGVIGGQIGLQGQTSGGVQFEFGAGVQKIEGQPATGGLNLIISR